MKTQNKKTTIENFIESLPKNSFESAANVGEAFTKLSETQYADFLNIVGGEYSKLSHASDLQGIIGDGVKKDGTLVSTKSPDYPNAVKATIIEMLEQGYTRNKLYKILHPTMTVAAPSAKKGQAFGPFELMTQARSMTKDVVELSTLDEIAALPEEVQAVAIELAKAETGTIINLAFEELTHRAQEKEIAKNEEINEAAQAILAKLKKA